jgi:hypothetical protein
MAAFSLLTALKFDKSGSHQESGVDISLVGVFSQYGHK